MIRSLKGRVTIAIASILATTFTLASIAVMHSFNTTLDHAAKERLASNTNTIPVELAREEGGQLTMPDILPNSRFNKQGDDNLRGYIYNQKEEMVWRSMSAGIDDVKLRPHFDHAGYVSLDTIKINGRTFLVHEIDITLSPSSQGYSFVTLIPAKNYFNILNIFRNDLLISIILTSLIIFGSFLIILWWFFTPFRNVSRQLNEIESGERTQLEGNFPIEVKRLTDSINTLLISEKKQREKYRTTMDDLTHSLKTPLMILQSFSTALRNNKAVNRQDIKELSLNLDTQINRMNQIVGYHLHRTVTGRQGLTRQAIQVEPIIRDLCRSLDKVYHDKLISIQINLDPACLFQGDEGDFLEIMGNLLENAFKFCHQLIIVSGYLEPGSEKNHGRLILIVEDDGPGISSEAQDQILQRGIRVDCQKPGQGIGLAIVSDLIEGYHGKITIDRSEVGGAAFSVCLP